MEYQYPKFTPEMKKTHTILIPNMAVHPVPAAGICTGIRWLQVRDPGQLRQRRGAAGPEIRPQRYLLPGAAGHRPVPGCAEQRQIRSRPYGPAHHPDGRWLPCFQLHPPAAQGAGQGRLPGDPGGQPELLGSGKRQRLPDDSAAGPHARWPASSTAICSCALRNQTAPYENEKGECGQAGGQAGWSVWAVSCWPARASTAQGDEAHVPAYRPRTLRPSRLPGCPRSRWAWSARFTSSTARWATTTWRSSWTSQDCEVNFPGLMGFVQYCVFNMGEDHVPVRRQTGHQSRLLTSSLNYLDEHVSAAMLKATADAGFYAPGPFKELVEKPKGVICLGAKMGEGWLLTAEMIELVQGGYGNIVCAQPFGCLPNHIVRQGHDQQDPRPVSLLPTSPPSTTTPAPPRSTRKTASS